MKPVHFLLKRFCATSVPLLFVAIILNGCTTLPAPQMVQRTIPVPEVQYVDATLIEGKTTRQQVIDALGTPDSSDPNSLSYSYYSDKKNGLRARLHIIYKDGTEQNIILGDNNGHHFVLIYFGGKYDSNGNYTSSNINTAISFG